MQIVLENISKRFKRNWVFRGVTNNFVSGKSYALVGSNGSGKSTLLKIIAGFEHATLGEITYSTPDPVHKSDFSNYFTFCSPYQELIREMKLMEFLDFHQKMTEQIDTKTLLQTVNLAGNEDKLLDNFSSGMIQRLKLGITFFTSRPIILLDEPTSTLDISGKEIFKNLFQEHQQEKLIIMASNEENEFSLCDHLMPIEDFKV